MTATMQLPKAGGHLHCGHSLNVRLAQRWGCQVTTAKARRERAVSDVLVVMEECLAIGDTARVGHILSLLDSALVGQPVERPGAIHLADRADCEEDVLECAYRESPCKQTARAWFDALGREGRSNEPAMAALRMEWSL